jgi:hypothetical protein
MRRRRQRQMALAGEQARGRIEPDPAGAGDVDLGPGVQVGEVLVGAARPFQRIDIRLHLDQIAGDEARREAEMPHDLDQSQLVSRQEPDLMSSVCSGSCTPGSMRMP